MAQHKRYDIGCNFTSSPFLHVYSIFSYGGSTCGHMSGDIIWIFFHFHVRDIFVQNPCWSIGIVDPNKARSNVYPSCCFKLWYDTPAGHISFLHPFHCVYEVRVELQIFSISENTSMLDSNRWDIPQLHSAYEFVLCVCLCVCVCGGPGGAFLYLYVNGKWKNQVTTKLNYKETS